MEVADGLVLDWVTETIALRVVQEAVRNTWRHAEASRVRVEFAVEGNAAVVRVEDDGRGFDPAAVVESGIAGMRRFVAFCEGELRIRSTAGAGTVVEARLAPPPGGPRPSPSASASPSPSARLRLVDGGRSPEGGSVSR